MAEKEQKAKATPKGVLRVATAAGVPSRWRAGRGFTAEPTEIALGELTADQVAALKADPYLQVESGE